MPRKKRTDDLPKFKTGLYRKFNCYSVRLVKYHYEIVEGERKKFASLHFVNHPSFGDSLLSIEVGVELRFFLEGYSLFSRAADI